MSLPKITDFTPAKIGYKDALPVLKPLKLHHKDSITVKASETKERLHSNLPETTLWRYNGTLPVFEIKKGATVHVSWLNEIGSNHLPFIHGKAEDNAEMNTAGRVNKFHDAENADGSDYYDPYNAPRTVTHVHGAVVQADSDGWTDNVCYKDQFQHAIYHNEQRGCMLWFHDHAMAVTRLNVYAGLVGLWVIRDEEEHHLHLDDHDRELFLVLQDKNLDANDAGELNGNILHKVANETMEFFGPYNMVNGKIWPRHSVQPMQYRLRILNGANARTYKLAWVDSTNAPAANLVIYKIGTDQGLLDRPIKINTGSLDEGLIIAPGERIDIVVDFSNCKHGEIYLKNMAAAPWNGTNVIDLNAAPDDENFNPFPEIMKFMVSGWSSEDEDLITDEHMQLTDFHQLTTADLHHPGGHSHKHRYIYLEEENGMVLLKELLPFEEFPVPLQKDGEAATDYDTRKAAFKQNYRDNMGTLMIKDMFGGTAAVKEFYVAAKAFNDKITMNDIMLSDDGMPTELWKIINATPDAHPFHIHLAQTQVLERFWITAKQADGTVVYDLTAKKGLDGLPVGEVWPNDRGWKDTMMINNSVNHDPDATDDFNFEVMVIAPKFEQFEGRYMYHCHILEHEDHEMMRPIVINSDHAMAMPM